MSSDNCACCHAETEVADQTCYLTQSQPTDNGPTSPSTDPIKCQAPGRVATREPAFKSLVQPDPQKPHRKEWYNLAIKVHALSLLSGDLWQKIFLCFRPHCLEYLIFISEKNSISFNFRREIKKLICLKSSSVDVCKRVLLCMLFS